MCVQHQLQFCVVACCMCFGSLKVDCGGWRRLCLAPLLPLQRAGYCGWRRACCAHCMYDRDCLREWHCVGWWIRRLRGSLGCCCCARIVNSGELLLMESGEQGGWGPALCLLSFCVWCFVCSAGKGVRIRICLCCRLRSLAGCGLCGCPVPKGGTHAWWGLELATKP